LAAVLGHPLFIDSGFFQAPFSASGDSWRQLAEPDAIRCMMVFMLAGVAVLMTVKCFASLRRSHLAHRATQRVWVVDEELSLTLV